MTGFVRHAIAGLVFIGVLLTYMLRVNLSVAILAMVNRTALAQESYSINATRTLGDHSSEGTCPRVNGSSEKQFPDGPFLWDQKTRGLILGAFFYGYVATELPGGWLAYRFGAKWILGFGILWTSIFTLLTPLTIYLDLHILLALRVLEGLGEGVTFPCCQALFAQWVPPNERSWIPAMTFAGSSIGTVIAFPFSAALCDTETGWPLVFYVFGAMGLVWSAIWFIYGASTPQTSRWISATEREYIRKSLEETVVDEKPSCSSVPWADIFKTPAMWALWMIHVAGTWGWHTLITLLPTFFNEVLHLGIGKNGILAAIPYILYTLVVIAAGVIADYVLAKKYVSVVVLRKVANTLGHVVPGIFLLLTTTIGCDVTIAVVMMCLAVGFEGLNSVGGYPNNLDVAGRYAGVTFGIANTLGSICGIVAPYVAGAITQGSTSMHRWRIVFGIVAGIYWASALVYLIFAQGHTAKWAVVEKKGQEKEEELRMKRKKGADEMVEGS